MLKEVKSKVAEEKSYKKIKINGIFYIVRKQTGMDDFNYVFQSFLLSLDL